MGRSWWPGDWVKYRSSEGYIGEGKILEIRPDDKLVIGQHNNDPEPVTVKPDDVIESL